MIIANQSGNVLQSNMPFEILQVSAANQSGFMNVNMHSLPLEYVIGNAYPNPFNPIVSFDYSISNSTNVQVNAYDLNGRKISSLINGHMEAGNHVIQWDAGSLPSGIYFIQFDIESQMETKKVILLK